MLAWLGLLTVLYLSISKAANRRRKGRDGPPTTPSSLAVLHPTLALFCPAEARAQCLFTVSEALATTFTEPTRPLRTADNRPCPFTTATHRLGLKPRFKMNECCTPYRLAGLCCTAHEHTVRQRGYAHVAVPRAEFIHSP